MLKYNLLVLCYCILRVQGIDLEWTDDWLCQNATSGNGIDLIYRCTEEIEKQNSNITWRYNGLPPDIRSVTIENCNTKIILHTNLYNISKLHSLTANSANRSDTVTKVLSDHLMNFTSVVIRNVTELTLDPHFKDLLSRLRGNASVLFEDVGLIKVLPTHLIKGPSPYIQKNEMKSFNFTMRRVKIQHAESRAVLWNKENIPFFMNWEKVELERAESTVEVIATTLDWPQSEIQEPEDNQVYIRNCTFKTMSTRAFILNTTVFQFTDNYVETFSAYGFDIDSLYTNISGNTFNRINNLAFGYTGIGKNKKNLLFDFNIINKMEEKSLYFQDFHTNLDLQQRVSFHGNKFQCHNAGWMQRSKNDTENMTSLNMKKSDYELLRSIENVFYMNPDNVCVEFQCEITVKDYGEFYLKHGKAPHICKAMLQ